MNRFRQKVIVISINLDGFSWQIMDDLPNFSPAKLPTKRYMLPFDLESYFSLKLLSLSSVQLTLQAYEGIN